MRIKENRFFEERNGRWSCEALKWSAFVRMCVCMCVGTFSSNGNCLTRIDHSNPMWMCGRFCWLIQFIWCFCWLDYLRDLYRQKFSTIFQLPNTHALGRWAHRNQHHVVAHESGIVTSRSHKTDAATCRMRPINCNWQWTMGDRSGAFVQILYFWHMETESFTKISGER